VTTYHRHNGNGATCITDYKSQNDELASYTIHASTINFTNDVCDKITLWRL